MQTLPASAEALLTLSCLLQQALPACHRLLAAFTSADKALRQPASVWAELGIGLAKRQRLASWQHGDLPEVEVMLEAVRRWLDLPGHTLLTLGDADYPRLLQEISDPPPLLFVSGDAGLLGLPQIAVVGSRHASQGGLANARAFAGSLASQGLVITSGLAAGIDGAAHHGALAANGRTVAVMGTGPDRIYPSGHRQLGLDIVGRGGAVVSEFLPGTPPLAPNFPRRNRIISGLGLGVLVVEAAVQSGSLITARLAGEQGRNVWALPGSIHNVQAKGCHMLIRDGAKLVDETAHIVEDLPPLLGVLQEGAVPKPRAEEGPSGIGAQVLEALAWESRSLDWLVEATGLPVGELAGSLLQLELEGRVAVANGCYERLARD